MDLQQREEDVTPSVKEDRNLLARAAAGSMEAREQVILNYYPLISNCVNNYVGRGVPREDLFQEGCYGLILAIDRFDPSRNTIFSSYAKHYVLKYIRKAVIEQNDSFSLFYNEDLYYEVMSYIDTKKKLFDEFQRNATDKELAERMNVTLKKIYRLKAAAFCLMSPKFSLDDPNTAIHVSALAYDTRSTETEFFSQLEPSDFCKNLTEREDAVLKRRFGYTPSGACETWDEISAATGLAVCTLIKAYNSGLEKLRKVVGEDF